MPDPRAAPAHGLLAVGGDLDPGTILEAYRRGIFPWPDHEQRLLWWSPDPRAVLPLEGFHESRRLRQRRRSGKFRTTRDAAFERVIAGCADRAEGTWITRAMIAGYTRLHRMGWAHSVEAWCGEELAGGVYGVAVGGLFAAESMFHRTTDASKVALAALVEHLRGRGFSLLDVQFLTAHLASLGAREITRDEYVDRLRRAIAKTVSF